MGYTENELRTFDLKMYLHGKNNAKEVKNLVLKINGVDSVDVIDQEVGKLGKVRISGNVEPQTVIKKLKEKKIKHAELVVEEEESPSKIKNQEMQIVHKSVRESVDQRKVAKFPSENVDPQTEKVKMSKKKHGELSRKDEQSPPKRDQKSVDQQKVAKTPPENVDPQTKEVKMSKKKHGELSRKDEQSPPKRDQRKVAKMSPENVDPQTEKVKMSKKKHGELLRKDEQSPPKRDQESVDQRKVAKTPPEIVDPQTEEVKKCKKKHKLELKKYNKPFKCSRCKEDGFTLGYGCKPCDYDLHKECLNPEPKITHKLFPGSIFEFREKPLECGRICDECDDYRRICDACGTRIYGCSYHCEADGWDLHPRCGNLREQLRTDGMDFVLISKNVKQNCLWCKEKLHSQFAKKNEPGWWYVSEPNKVYCHVYCIFQIWHEAWKRGALVHNDDDDNNDGASKALAKVNLKLVAKSNGSGGRGGRLFLKAVTLFLKAIVGILFGDPTGLIVFAVTELIQN